MECNTCGKKLKNTDSVLKDHNYNLHINEVFVGESFLAVSRINGRFTCHICKKVMKTTSGFRSHMVKHGLKMSIQLDKSLPQSKKSLEDFEDVSTDNISPRDSICHIPPEELNIKDSPKNNKKRKLLSYSQTILASSDSVTADTQEQTDKLMIAKLGRWVPIIYESEGEQHGLLTSARSATTLLQESSDSGPWKKPATDIDPTTGVPSYKEHCDSDYLIEHIKSKSQAAKKLSETCHEELTLEQSNILNQDWLEYPHLRYCGSQMLAGAILVEGPNSILLNTVEPYSRDPLLDAHYEKFTTGQSTFPTSLGIYGFLSICLVDTQDGRKLIIGTRTCNFLITSSMRLDVHSINLGPSTTHFTPTKKTRLFLDKASLDIVKTMLQEETINKCQQMPILYQLRQLRSKFDCLSTYTKCRASSSFTSHPFLQPTTIWTLSSQNGSSSNLINLSQDKIGALIFRTLAVQVSRYGAHASLDRVAVDEVAALTKSRSTSAIFQNIHRLFDNKEEIDIIGNSALNSQLTDLANSINKKKDDEKKVQSIIDELYD
ncbi:hypothetical protein INT47_007318 [Mucor saturninus]|uniref:C2H2-type domain-containing protein n=1 Tax=Mucor saturninus TaxID=64648 RepID=A0A8H7V9M4_9FUNG|nr:hypothetical protein INT47_007318 [Mucor saturninus]